MRILLPTVLLAAGFISACADRTPSIRKAGSADARVTASTADSVRDILDQLNTAAVKRDSSAIARLLDESYVGVAPSGDTLNRASALAGVTDTNVRYDSLVDTRPPAIQVEGDSATVEGQVLVHGVQREQVFIHRANYTYRLLRRPDGWRVTFEQFKHAQ